MKRSLLSSPASLLIPKKGNWELLNFTQKYRVSRVAAIRVISLTAVLGVLTSLTVYARDDQMGEPDQKPDPGQTQNSPAGPAMKNAISEQLTDLTSRISRLENATKHMHPADSSTGREMQSSAMDQSMAPAGTDMMQASPGAGEMPSMPMMGQAMKQEGMGSEQAGMGTMQASPGAGEMPAMPMGQAMKQEGMGSEQAGMGMMQASPGAGEMPSPPMGQSMKREGIGMMGMDGPPALLQSALPGFPGASHLYHIGATDFFLDHSGHISLAGEQQKSLNQTKEDALLAKASAERQISEAKQELWQLTAADQPDASKIEAKIQAIEKLRGDERMAFIRSVGAAGKVLTDEQRQALLEGKPAGAAASPTSQR